MATAPSTYRDVLKQSLQIVKKNKFLWIFGFFAAFLGTSGEFETVFRDYSNVGEASQNIFGWQSWYRLGLIGSMFENIKAFFTDYTWQSIFILLMLIAVALVMLWLAIIAQIALVDGANKLSRNKQVTYHDGFRAGNRHFLPILLINVIMKVLLYALLVVIGAPLLAWFLVRSSAAGGTLFVVLVFLIFIPLSVIISFVVKYAVAYIVINGKKAGEAVRLGWQLFRQNWLISIEMALLILLIGLVVGLGIFVLLGILSIPFIVIVIAALIFGSATGFAAAVAMGVVMWFIAIAIVGSAYAAYQHTAWTLLFMKLDAAKAESKLARWFGKLVPKKAA